MTFTKLASYFEQLEITSSRLSLIAILSELFKSSTQEEIAMIVYLTQGRVGPFFDPVEIGMADKMVAQAVAEGFGLSKEEVLTLYNKKGDLGIVAYGLRAKRKSHETHKKLSVKDVFTTFLEIAHTAGVGSVEKKIQALTELLSHMDAVSAKHLVRIPLGVSRLGIGDPTVLDGLALGVLGDRSKRKLLEKAYNETSDLGLIAETLFKGGLQEVAKLKITVGRPIRSELCERLPNPEKVFEKMAYSTSSVQGIHATPKYDGFRVQIHKNGDKVQMFSRNLENMTHMFPELIKGTLAQVKAHSAILDCEALAYQVESEEFLPFQETTKRRRKHNIEEVAKALPLRAFVFDLLYVDGKSLIDEPLLKRMEVLRHVVHNSDILIPAPGEILDTPKKLQTMLDDAISKGLEGVVVKRIDSPYEAGGRNFNWVKLKRHSSGELQDTIDCIILGYIEGRGKRTAFGVGALLVGVYDDKKDEFVTVSKIGTGLSDEEWRYIHARADKIKVSHKPARVQSFIEPSVWIKPDIVIEVLADEITRSPIHTAGKDADNPGYALRFPRLVSFRDKDKKPEDATTVRELVAMYNQQGKK